MKNTVRSILSGVTGVAMMAGGAVDAVAQLLAKSDRVRDAATVDDAAWGFREQIRGVLQLVYQLTKEDADE